ncbi:recombinase family protein [Deinococcus ficus]|uniref:recombinase family protein n=1 Tax=Deinococcus ficus TaxID=317577 RepID=UPI00174E3192|nr:recombinase family protein [Deinococcus ficus]GHF91081.1 hypothetical protein GCM10017782_30110 [Deinococcus ficus]
MTRPAASYKRVSSEKQADEGRFGLQVQQDAIERYAARAGFTLTGHYEDRITGTTATRDGLTALTKAAKQYEAVIISSIDRLGRRVKVSYAVLGELTDAGLEVHAADLGLVDMDSETGNMAFGFSAVMAESEHRRLARRMHEARIRKVALGTVERPLNGYGWRKGEPDEREQHWVRWMYAQAAHHGTHTIAEQLNAQGVTTRAGRKWSPRTVGLILQNPMYMGEYRFGLSRGTVRAVCACPAIVTPEVWARANDRRVTVRSSRLDTFPLTGRLTCGECGAAVSGTTMKEGRYAYYVCRSVFLPRSIRKACSNTRRIPAHQLHAAVNEALQHFLTDDQALRDATRTPTPEPINTHAMTADVQRRLARLDAAYEAGAFGPDEYASKRRAMLAERDALVNTPIAPPTPVNLDAARAELAHALTLPSLADTARHTHLHGTLYPGGRLQLTLGE